MNDKEEFYIEKCTKFINVLFRDKEDRLDAKGFKALYDSVTKHITDDEEDFMEMKSFIEEAKTRFTAMMEEGERTGKVDVEGVINIYGDISIVAVWILKKLQTLDDTFKAELDYGNDEAFHRWYIPYNEDRLFPMEMAIKLIATDDGNFDYSGLFEKIVEWRRELSA